MEDLVLRAKQVIEKILYITIATVNGKGEPWNSPVYFAFDEDYNFYWTSALTSEHSKNILTTGKVFLVIYDSTVAEGRGFGVYIQASARMLENETEIISASKYTYGRKHKQPPDASNFIGKSPRRIWKAIPERVWINTDEKVDGFHVDARKEIKLK